MASEDGPSPSPSPPYEQGSRTDLIMLNGFLVFFMQAGFVALEAGQGRAKNTKNILLKNTVDVLLCALCWWAVGFAFAYGDSAGGGFIGYTNFFNSGDGDYQKPWFFTWTFVLSCVTIASGCLAERTHLFAYPVYTALLSLLVHPIAVHWTWSRDGWLSRVNDTCSFLDFAGGTVVHMMGGLTGLVGAVICGPRLGRFEDGVDKEIPGHDMSSASMGTFMLFFGWFGFNCGSVYLYSDPTGETVNRVATNMTLAASSAGLTALLFASFRTGTFDIRVCCNGLLSGLVAGTSLVGFITTWAAVVAGTLAGALYVLNSKLLVYLGVDDPLDSSAVHFGSGLLGTFLIGVLARPAYVMDLTGQDCGGIVYNHNGWLQLGIQVLGLVVVLGWTLFWTITVFIPLKRFNLLRVDQTTELAGIDNIEHGGPAYPEWSHADNRTHS